jgi:hypothetical protein
VLAAALFALAIQDPADIPQGRRPEPPPPTEAQAAEDARHRVTEGERSGDAATPGRFICQLTRLPGSNLRTRHCATAEDRRRARELAREVLPGGAGGTSAG